MSKYLRIKVIPNAKKTEIVEILKDEEHGETWRIRVQAPPEKGKANQALIDFLAEHFKIKKNAVSILNGHASPIKLIKIHELESNP